MLIISFFLMLLVFMNFSWQANKLSYMAVWKIFMEIKIISLWWIKLMSVMLIFLFFNYNSYIYYSLGLTMYYGEIFIYAFLLVLMVWGVWFVNNSLVMMSHFLPSGIEGVLKLFIPVLEMIGVLIRPMTLAIRLATNISCGHVVLLMFSFFAFNSMSLLVLSISILLFGLYFIEFLVCMIQAYVFWSLLYIYMMEVEI